jgi:hypothetical protein
MIRIILFTILVLTLVGLISLGDAAITWGFLKFIAYCIVMFCILAGIYLLIPYLNRD